MTLICRLCRFISRIVSVSRRTNDVDYDKNVIHDNSTVNRTMTFGGEAVRKEGPHLSKSASMALDATFAESNPELLEGKEWN